jgi:type I restriction enzyme S subunit
MSVSLPFGILPSNWKVERLDRLFRVVKEEARLDDEPISAFIDGVVTLRSNRPDAIIKGSGQEIGYKHLEKNDLVISGMNAHLGGLGISDSAGKCTPVYTILRKTQELNERYISYYLWHAAKSGYIKSLVNAVRYNSADFGPQTIKNFMVLVPPIEDQVRIASYLDAQLATIDAISESKMKIQQLLSAASQAEFTNIFGHPFFSSENNNASRRLGPCLLANDGGVWGDEPVGSGDSLVLRSTEISRRGYWRDLDDAAYRKLEKKDARNSRLMADDIVVTKASGSPDHIGKAAIVTKEIEELNACFGNFMQRIRVNPDIYLPEYLHFFLKSHNARSQFNFLGTTSTGLMNISAEVLNNLRVPLVSLNEQQETIHFLREIEMNFDTKLDLMDKSISTFAEFKTALITAAVTGTFEIITGRNVA